MAVTVRDAAVEIRTFRRALRPRWWEVLLSAALLCASFVAIFVGWVNVVLGAVALLGICLHAVRWRS
jgi:hypothetical protein